MLKLPALETVIGALRDARWLDADRARSYSRVLAICLVAAVLWGSHLAMNEVARAPGRKPLATDFVTFWAASKLTLDGHPAQTYDVPTIEAAQRDAAFIEGVENRQTGEKNPGTQDPGGFPFFYPPPFLLLCLPLALAPYVVSMVVWIGLSWLAIVRIVRHLLPIEGALLPILAAPALLINAVPGQTGAWVASCFGVAMLFLETRPALAGMALAAVSLKPHMALCIPIALVAAQRWRALATFVMGAAGLAFASMLVFGAATWISFFDAFQIARDTLENHPEDWSKMLSIHAGVRMLRGGLDAAYSCQAIGALVAFVLLAASASRRPGAAAEIACLSAATLLCTPHLMDYDLVLTLLPVAWIARTAIAEGWLAWERLLVLAVYVLPLVARPASVALHAPLGPPILMGLLLVCARRCSARLGVARCSA